MPKKKRTPENNAEGPGKSLTALVVDPSHVLCQVINSVASRINIRIEHAKNVGDAINLICKSKPVAILTSLELEGLSGLSLVAAIKSCPRHRAIPIALVTGNPKAESLFDQYQPDTVIAKSRDMTKAIGRFFTSLGLNIQRNTQDNNIPLPLADYKSRILLAEDSQCVQRLLGRFLHVAGADVTVVGTGIAALEAVEESTFDLILMDIEMPEMDGRMATMRLRDNGVTTPIIALTAHSHEKLSTQAIQVGFNEVLSKPVDRFTLVDMCKKYLPLRSKPVVAAT